ncbi:MAG: ATP-binding cassette domain-containing protein [Clostridia bacterium]
MLKLKNITKTYISGNEKVEALKGINIEFRESEFVSILGQSGCGKTTLLNIIGGLDRYTTGDLIINEKSTKDFKDRDWDSYRNYSVGFVFQSYNLITHQTVLSNVELALTISGVSKKEKRQRAIKALEEVGLKDQINKKPNQLSGGQMQRVAIARALVNNPDIILADEPTGALDTKTSMQVMEILKEISKNKLIIMVTHNPELAEKYSSRVIKILDGKIIDDSNPIQNDEKQENKKEKDQKLKRTSMKFFTAIHLSLNNLMTKKARTILTSFAGSIGIIGIALILSLSSGVQDYINRVQEEALTSYPLTIEEESVDITSAISEIRKDTMSDKEQQGAIEDKIYSNNIIGDMLSIMGSKIQSNNLELFKKYLESEESNIKDYTTAIGYEYDLNLQLYKSDTSSGILQVNPNTVLDSIGIPSEGMGANIILNDVWSEMFENEEINKKMYKIVSGKMPENYNEVVLLVDENNQISDYVLYALGLKDQNELEELYKKVNEGEKIETEEISYNYDELIGLSYKVLLNTDYFEKVNHIWVDKSEDEEYLKRKLEDAEEIKVVGIVKPGEEWSGTRNETGGILYTDELEKHIINKINAADIVKEQKENPNRNVITGLEFSNEEFNIEKLSTEQKRYLQSLPTEELADVVSKYKEQAEATYESILLKLGAVDLEKPSAINIYAKDFEAKEEIKNLIEDYNQKQRDNGNDGNVINYSDLVGMLMSSVTQIIDMISYVLIAFVSISLVVSSIMIGIITYISVLERTKEIGILRSIGASKKDISRVFNAETLIVGLTAGVLGIGITLLLNIPINIIIENVANVSNLSSLPLVGAVGLVAISVALTMIAGLIPAKIASKKDPVESLRSE